jgi:hypothetical protein
MGWSLKRDGSKPYGTDMLPSRVQWKKKIRKWSGAG